MSVRSNIRTYLLAQAGVSSIVGTRIYYDALPQSATLPAVVLEMSDSYPAGRHLAASGTLERASYTAYCYATTRATADSLSDAVSAALDEKTGTWTDTTVVRTHIENTYDISEPPRDGSAAWRFIGAVVFAIWHR